MFRHSTSGVPTLTMATASTERRPAQCTSHSTRGQGTRSASSPTNGTLRLLAAASSSTVAPGRGCARRAWQQRVCVYVHLSLSLSPLSLSLSRLSSLSLSSLSLSLVSLSLSLFSVSTTAVLVRLDWHRRLWLMAAPQRRVKVYRRAYCFSRYRYLLYIIILSIPPVFRSCCVAVVDCDIVILILCSLLTRSRSAQPCG